MLELAIVFICGFVCGCVSGAMTLGIIQIGNQEEG